MTHPILVTGAADGTQGSTGRLVASLLMERGIPVRALVHHVDARSDELRKQGAEVVEGDLLNSASVQAAMRNVKRAYFTYPVADGLLQAVAIFAETARDTGLELVVNNSQFQGTPGDPAFRDLRHAPSFRNLLADRIFDWAQVGAVHLQAPPYYENVRALVSRSVAEQSTVFLHSPGLLLRSRIPRPMGTSLRRHSRCLHYYLRHAELALSSHGCSISGAQPTS